jgi:DNA-binding MarR family transcriptional regulator
MPSGADGDALPDTADVVADVLELATDITARHLIQPSLLSTSASLVLNRVHREGPMRLKDLAEKEGLGQPAMTQLVQRLASHGLLDRLCDPYDGRGTLVQIAEAGKALLAERTDARRARLAELLTTLSADDEAILWRAAQVWLPIVRRLGESATTAKPAAGTIG